MQHEYIFRIFGKESHKQITANLDLLLRRFNEVKNVFTLFVRYYECISLLDCILIGSKVKSGLSVIISSFHLLGPALGRNTDSPHSTSQQAGLSVEKVHQVSRTVSDSSRNFQLNVEGHLRLR